MNKLPTPSDKGVKWITPDIFIYKGKQYEVTIHGKVIPLKIPTEVKNVSRPN
jgi:hypothetical protein